MNKVDTEELFSELVKTVGEKLKPLGYSRRGQVFRIIANNNCGLISFQRSTSNTKDSISFTINLGVICGYLWDVTIPQLKDAQIGDAHLSLRIGHLLPGHQDKWWQISSLVNFEQLSGEIVDLVSSKAVPYMAIFLIRIPSAHYGSLENLLV